MNGGGHLPSGEGDYSYFHEVYVIQICGPNIIVITKIKSVTK